MPGNRQRLIWEEQSRTAGFLYQRYVSFEAISVGCEEGLKLN
jgi:hypothetical protein